MPQKPKAERPLPPRWRLFIHEFGVDKNATQALIRAGFSRNGAKQTAYRIMQDPRVKPEIDKLLAKHTAKADLRAEAVLERWRRIGLVDLSGLLEWTPDGVKVRADAKPTPDQLVAIAEMMKGAKPGAVVEINTTAQRDALDALSRHFNLFKYPLQLGDPGGDEPTAIVIGRYSDVVGRFRRKRD